MHKKTWIHSATADLLFILLPPLFCLAIIALFPQWFGEQQPMTTVMWVVLVMCIDVAHVYSTLYRTYFDRELFNERKALLIVLPVLCYVGGVILCMLSMEWFWRILAYVAVFHFVRQQYGFLRIYSRFESQNWQKNLDTVTIYSTMLYPIIWWHLHPGRAFSWFVQGDFIQPSAPLEMLSTVLGFIYLLILIFWLLKEITVWVKHKSINIPKVVLVSGTAASWYFGIVYFNGDLPFTLLNVVSHGIPYMALIWMYGRKNYQQSQQPFLRNIFSPKYILAFAGLLIVFAFAEEWLWDIMVWNERPELFGTLRLNVQDNYSEVLALLVPLLALPQLTHYVLDGFIWKISKDKKLQQLN